MMYAPEGMRCPNCKYGGIIVVEHDDKTNHIC